MQSAHDVLPCIIAYTTLRFTAATTLNRSKVQGDWPTESLTSTPEVHSSLTQTLIIITSEQLAIQDYSPEPMSRPRSSIWPWTLALCWAEGSWSMSETHLLVHRGVAARATALSARAVCHLICGNGIILNYSTTDDDLWLWTGLHISMITAFIRQQFFRESISAT